MAIEKFVFCAILPPVVSAISGKASNRKRPSHFARLQLQPGASCVFRRTAQPSAMCGALYARANEMENARRWRKALAHAVVRCTNGEIPCCAERRARKHPPFGPTSTFTIDDTCFCLCHCVSAADQMQIFPDAPLSPNMRTQI